MRINLRAWEAAGLAAGRITMLCRSVKPSGECVLDSATLEEIPGKSVVRSPFGSPGDVLLCRESFFYERAEYEWIASFSIPIIPSRLSYRADHCTDKKAPAGSPWKSAQQMPDEYIRHRPTVVSVRCCRVQEITEREWLATGACDGPFFDKAEHVSAGGAPYSPEHLAFIYQFDRDNGPGSYAANKWVWVGEVKL